MDPVWTTTVLLVPCVVVLTAGLFYLYSAVVGLLSKTSVRNKVVVITDALSGLGKGKHRQTSKRNLSQVLTFMTLCCSSFLSMKNAQVCFTKGGRG